MIAAGADIAGLRADFPILDRVVYLDDAATTQKPRVAIEAISRLYAGENANVHRGIHRLGVDVAARASLAFYNTRADINALVSGLERVREVFG